MISPSIVHGQYPVNRKRENVASETIIPVACARTVSVDSPRRAARAYLYNVSRITTRLCVFSQYSGKETKAKRGT